MTDTSLHTETSLQAEIRIRRLMVRCVVGFKDEEREHPQDVAISVKVGVDVRRIVASDALEGSLNYRELSKRLIRVAMEAQPYSLERLAFLLVKATFGTDPSVMQVDLTVEKQHALRYAKGVAVTMNLSRAEFGLLGIVCE